MTAATIPGKPRTIWEYTLRRRKVLEFREEDRGGGPREIVNLLTGLGLHEEEQEHFMAVVLDTKHQVKGLYTVTIGLVDQCHVHSREVFRTAIMLGASRMVVAHNHPSGDPTPSAGDIACTRDLAAAGKIIGIEVVDHIIIGWPSEDRPDRMYVSFKEEKLF